MQHTAKGIASLGRNGDDTLLHVNKEELAGLQALLGPVTVNPETGLPEAFSWTDILTSLGVGILGAVTGGAAAPALGAIGSTVVGAGTGALAGGALSAAQGKGFGPGALGGAISGGMGGFGAADIPGGPTAISSTGTDAVNTMVNAGPEADVGNLSAVMPEEQITAVPPSAWDQYTANLGKTGSAMFTKPGMEHLMKPIGLGTMLGFGAQSTMEEANTSATQMRQEKLKQAQADAEQRQYFQDIGFPLPAPGAGTSWSPNQQRNYFDQLVYGKAAGGPIEMSRMVAGMPVQTTVPPKFVSQFEKANLGETLGPAMEDLQGIAQGTAQQLSARGFVTGGYINTQPMGTDPYPQSQIPKAQPYPAATPQRHEVVSAFAEGGSTYEKGGFLDGPGDGMSDDIPANIDGQEEVRLADGEFVVPPELVSLIGGGDPEEGKRLLDQLLPMVRQAAHGKKEQIKQDAGKLAAEKLLTRKLAKGDAGRSGIEAAG
jgi:hypothetical protein